MTLNIPLLEQSFADIKPRAHEFIASFYKNLFTDYPDSVALFDHTNMAIQEDLLLRSLVFVVDNLRQPDVLSEALKGLGARHAYYGALPEHYSLIGSSLLKTFADYLGSKWTPSVEQAWAEAFTEIATLMLEGAEHAQETVKPPAQ